MDPESVVLQALRARDEWRYADVVALVDPEALDEQFADFCALTRPVTIERFAEINPELSGEALTESFRRWCERMTHLPQPIPHVVPGVETYEELVALGAARFLARRLEHEDSRKTVVDDLRSRGCAVPQSLLGTPEDIEYVVIGSVYETETLVHVLYRKGGKRAEGAPHRGSVEHVSLRRQDDGGWRLLMDTVNFLGSPAEPVSIFDDDSSNRWTAG